MSDAIIVALITVTANIVIQVISAANQSKALLEKLKAESQLSDAKLQAKLDTFQAVQTERIDELCRQVEKHNKMVERTYALEERVARHDEKIQNLLKENS